jgi:hypothetical protein
MRIRETARHEQQPPREDHEAPCRVIVPARVRLGDAEPDDERDEGHRDRRHHERRREILVRRGEDATRGEGADDGARLEPDDEQPAARRVVDTRGLPSAALEDERDLERQPHDVEALQRPRDEKVQNDVANASHQVAPPSGSRRSAGSLVPVHVAELARIGTTRAESSCAASNQLTSESWMPSLTTMSLNSGT